MSRRTRRSIPPDLRTRLEVARLDTFAFLRALDRARLPMQQLPQPHTNQVFELDADCAEALWALDQPAGALDFAAMVRDTLTSLDDLGQARQDVRDRLPASVAGSVARFEQAIRATLDPREAYNDVPGRDPSSC